MPGSLPRLFRPRTWFRSEPEPAALNPRRMTSQEIFDQMDVKVRDGADTFVLSGDNSWGNSVTWSTAPTDADPNKGTVAGWMRPRPVVGDRLAVEMKSGKWGVWVFVEVEHHRDPPDMFHGTVVGAFSYLPDDEAPTRKSASALLRSRGGFV